MSSVDADVARGLQALTTFFNYSVNEYGDTFAYSSFDQFYTAVKAVKGSTFIAEGIGTAIDVNEMSDSKVTKAMQALADQGHGKIPSTMNGWFTALINQSTQINFLEAVQYTAVESAGDIVDGAAQVGDAVIATGKSFLAVGPLAILAAALFLLYRFATEQKV